MRQWWQVVRGMVAGVWWAGVPAARCQNTRFKTIGGTFHCSTAACAVLTQPSQVPTHPHPWNSHAHPQVDYFVPHSTGGPSTLSLTARKQQEWGTQGATDAYLTTKMVRCRPRLVWGGGAGGRGFLAGPAGLPPLHKGQAMCCTHQYLCRRPRLCRHHQRARCSCCSHHQSHTDAHNPLQPPSQAATQPAALATAENPTRTQTLRPLGDSGLMPQPGQKPKGFARDELDKPHHRTGLRVNYRS